MNQRLHRSHTIHAFGDCIERGRNINKTQEHSSNALCPPLLPSLGSEYSSSGRLPALPRNPNLFPNLERQLGLQACGDDEVTAIWASAMPGNLDLQDSSTKELQPLLSFPGLLGFVTYL